MSDVAGKALDMSPGAGEAPHGAGAPNAQPDPAPEAPAPAAEAPAAAPEAPAPAAAPEAPAPTVEVPLDQIMSRPDVRAELSRQAKLAARQAVEASEEKARREAERAKMDEVERLKLEKAEAEQAADRARADATAAARERDLANTLIAADAKLANPRALDFLRFNAFALCDNDPDMSMDDAVQRVLKEHAYLVTQPEAAVPQTAQSAPEPPPPPPERPSTAPPIKPTQAPAAAKPTEGVDVLSMSKQEYEEYKRAHHPSIH